MDSKSPLKGTLFTPKNLMDAKSFITVVTEMGITFVAKG